MDHIMFCSTGWHKRCHVCIWLFWFLLLLLLILLHLDVLQHCWESKEVYWKVLWAKFFYPRNKLLFEPGMHDITAYSHISFVVYQTCRSFLDTLFNGQEFSYFPITHNFSVWFPSGVATSEKGYSFLIFLKTLNRLFLSGGQGFMWKHPVVKPGLISIVQLLDHYNIHS